MRGKATDTYLTLFDPKGRPIFTRDEREEADLCVLVATKNHALVYRFDEIRRRLNPRNDYSGTVLWVANPTLEIESLTAALGIDKKSSGSVKKTHIDMTEIERVVAQATPYRPR